MSLDPALLEILACPACKAPVKETPAGLLCQNSSCSLCFPVKNGIPVMLVEEASRPGKAS